jgi:hypothetical protein
MSTRHDGASLGRWCSTKRRAHSRTTEPLAGASSDAENTATTEAPSAKRLKSGTAGKGASKKAAPSQAAAPSVAPPSELPISGASESIDDAFVSARGLRQRRHQSAW